ncbi:unnamed protein product [Caenorhabditis sp. 36 PRJEB53466]|nr:unnamed protein product [Caenorhabditis sp. 36 PRJEB53466]
MRYSQKCRVTAVLLENIRAGLDIKRSFEELIKLDLPVDIIHKQYVKDVAKRFIGIVEVQEDALKLLGQCIQKITGSSASNRAPQTMLQPSEKKTSCPSSSSSNSSSSCRSSTPSSTSSTSAPTVAAAAEKKTSEEDEKLQRFLAARKRALAVVALKQTLRRHDAPIETDRPRRRVREAQVPGDVVGSACSSRRCPEAQEVVVGRTRSCSMVPAGGRPSETLSMLESSRLFRIQQAQDIKRFGEPERKRQRRNFH